MDNPGWHAKHRAQKDDERWSTPQRGPDGRFQPVEQVLPLSDNYSVPPLSDDYMGGFVAPPSPQPSVGPEPPPLPPKDHDVWVPGHVHQGASDQSSQSTHQTSGAVPTDPRIIAMQQYTHMSAQERSKNLRVVRMHPLLQFMAGPLLRYDTVDESGTWRGAALIVTADAGSVYDPEPFLTYSFDPNSLGLPKNGIQRRATSRSSRSGKSFDLGPHPADPLSIPYPVVNGEYTLNGPNVIRQQVNGQEIWVYFGNGGTFTFWRFMIEIPLAQEEMRVTYNINNGLDMHFFVPGRAQNMRWAAFSCNGFSAGVNPDDFRGPGFQSGYDPVWVDLLAKHDADPFHVLVGGGDQLYCDGIVREPEMQEWVTQKGEAKQNFQLTDEINGAFARANSSIPMLNMLDDHDLIDGFGSYPDDLMKSSVFSTIGARGYFFFLLFQCFINMEADGRDDRHHPFQSLIIGDDGPFVPFPSHSFLSYLGPRISILALDCRAERKKDQVCSSKEYKAVFERAYRLPLTNDHLVVLTGIPVAYPRMVFLETALDSKMNPLTALGRSGALGLSGFVNKFNADAELLDDLNDHWTSKSHKRERNWFIEQLQQYAKSRHTRITILSGDVHCAAVGVLKTLAKGKSKPEIAPALDYRYMLNVVSSAIVNTPPPNGVLTLVSALATKTHRTLHHMDTDESMVPVFERDTGGGAPKSKYIMGRRNWCSVRWEPVSGDLIFDIRVEREKGYGETVGYAVRAPPPRWN